MSGMEHGQNDHIRNGQQLRVANQLTSLTRCWIWPGQFSTVACHCFNYHFRVSIALPLPCINHLIYIGKGAGRENNNKQWFILGKGRGEKIITNSDKRLCNLVSWVGLIGAILPKTKEFMQNSLKQTIFNCYQLFNWLWVQTARNLPVLGHRLIKDE